MYLNLSNRLLNLCLYFVLSVAAVRGESNDVIQIRYLSTLGEKGEQPGMLRDPSGISIDPSGCIYIADTGNNRIQKWDSFGNVKSVVGGFGWEREQFDRPVAVWAKNGLDVFVADYQNQRVERYDKDLHYLASWKSSEILPENLQFGYPIDVDFSTQGEMFCLDEEYGRIIKLDILGNPYRSFGDFDSGAGRLVRPSRLYVASDGYVYVSDVERKQVVVFDGHGNFIQSLGKGILSYPMGMTVLPGHILCVADLESGLHFLRLGSGEPKGDLHRIVQQLADIDEVIDVAFYNQRLVILDRKSCSLVLLQWTVQKGESSQ